MLPKTAEQDISWWLTSWNHNRTVWIGYHDLQTLMPIYGKPWWRLNNKLKTNSGVHRVYSSTIYNSQACHNMPYLCISVLIPTLLPWARSTMNYPVSPCYHLWFHLSTTHTVQQSKTLRALTGVIVLNILLVNGHISSKSLLWYINSLLISGVMLHLLEQKKIFCSGLSYNKQNTQNK